MLELIKGKNGEKNCPARKNRKREDNDDFIKEIARLQRPRRSSKKRQSQPILNSTPPFPGIRLPILLCHEYYKVYPSVREDVVSSGMGNADTIG